MSNVKRIKAQDLIVDWDLNPRGELDLNTHRQYVDHLSAYVEEGQNINDVWKQEIKSTTDLYVIQGCHTVTAMLQVDPEYMLDVEIVDVESTDVAETRFHAAQSNVHGKPLSGSEKRVAISWMLDGANLKKTQKDPNLRPFMSNVKIAALVGCGKDTVARVRNEMLGKPPKKESKPESPIIKSEFDPEVVDADDLEGDGFYDGPDGDDPDIDEDSEELDIEGEEFDDDDPETAEMLAEIEKKRAELEALKEESESEDSDDIEDEEDENPELEELNRKLAEKQAELDASSEEESEEEESEPGKDKAPKKRSQRQRMNSLKNEFFDELDARIVDLIEGRSDAEIDQIVAEVNKTSRKMDNLIETLKPDSHRRYIHLAMRSIVYHIADRIDVMSDSE